MQTVYVIIKKEYLALYEKNGNSFEQIYLNGNPEYSYSLNSAKDGMDKMLIMLAEQYNLDSIGEIDLIVIDNEDKITSETILRALGNSVTKKIPVEQVIQNAVERLNRDKKLHILKYGVNYDGRKYGLSEGKITQSPFSLLAYTVSDDMLMRYVG